MPAVLIKYQTRWRRRRHINPSTMAALHQPSHPNPLFADHDGEDDDDDEDEWQMGGNDGGGIANNANGEGSATSRYPIHDAAEFEDAEVLRRLIFVPASDDDDSSSSSDDDDDEDDDDDDDSMAASSESEESTNNVVKVGGGENSNHHPVPQAQQVAIVNGNNQDVGSITNIAKHDNNNEQGGGENNHNNYTIQQKKELWRNDFHLFSSTMLEYLEQFAPSTSTSTTAEIHSLIRGKITEMNPELPSIDVHRVSELRTILGMEHWTRAHQYFEWYLDRKVVALAAPSPGGEVEVMGISGNNNGYDDFRTISVSLEGYPWGEALKMMDTDDDPEKEGGGRRLVVGSELAMNDEEEDDIGHSGGGDKHSMNHHQHHQNNDDDDMPMDEAMDEEQAKGREEEAPPTTKGPGESSNMKTTSNEHHHQQRTTKRKIQPKLIKYSCPYDLDERDDDENTPLHIAIHARKIDNVRVLLEGGATVHKKCDGSAPLHLAISLGAIGVHTQFATDCVALLKQYNADVTMRDDSWHTPLYLACLANLYPVVEMLLQDPLARETLNLRADRTGGRALHAAARADDVRRRTHAVGGGGAVGVSGGGAGRGKKFLGGGGGGGGSSGGCVTELLLSMSDNIEIDAQNNYGRTPLHIAASRGNWHVVRLLVNAGAKTHVLDKRGLTPGQRARKRGMVIPNDLLKLLGGGDEDGEDDDEESVSLPPTRDLIMDPDGRTLILCHELCIQHRTCPPIVRSDADTSEPPPENVRRLNVLINDDDGILRSEEFSGCVWYTDVRRAAMSDVLKVHEYPYIERTSKLCNSTPDHPRAIQTLDADTTVSHWSFEAALRAAGSVCEAVDKVVAGDFRNAFCAIRPPGHHAGPRGIVTCQNDPDGSHGFCLLNNVAIGAAYARSMYRNDGIKKIAIIDFDVHHGNGTEEIVRQLTPNIEHAIIRTPFAVGGLHASTYKPWLDENDMNDVFFASTHGYGPRDRQLPPGAVQGGWFYPASGETYKSKSLIPPSDMETPSLSDFLMSQTWARLGEDYRNNCCKIIDIGLSLPAKDDHYNHGLQRLELRDAYRKNILPSLLEFDPDIIFISAGFDAHRKDTMNFGYVGMIEEDYEWITEQIVKIANKCCNGRVVSALEGGYKIHGGIVSPFARSVASHVRALVDGGNSREEYDKDEGDWESRFERHMNEEKEKKRQMKMDRHARTAENLYALMSPGGSSSAVAEKREMGGGGTALLNDDIDDNNNHERSRKRSRKHVDYKHLFEQMQKEGH